MAEPIHFEGHTHDFGPPPGESERCGRLPVFMNGVQVVSAWKLTPAELQRVVETGEVWISVWSGTAVLPVFVGTESTVAAVVSDFGKIWKK